MKTTTRRVVTVLNKLGVGKARTYEYYNENSRVGKIEAEVYDIQGKLLKRYQKRDF